MLLLHIRYVYFYYHYHHHSFFFFSLKMLKHKQEVNCMRGKRVKTQEKLKIEHHNFFVYVDVYFHVWCYLRRLALVLLIIFFVQEIFEKFCKGNSNLDILFSTLEKVCEKEKISSVYYYDDYTHTRCNLRLIRVLESKQKYSSSCNRFTKIVLWKKLNKEMNKM